MFVRKIENWLLVRQLWAKWEEGKNAGKNAAAVGKGGDKVNNGEASRDEEKRPQTRTVIQCSNVTVGEVMEEFQATFPKFQTMLIQMAQIQEDEADSTKSIV